MTHPRRRMGTVAVAGVCLVLGVVIGLAVPRAASLVLPGSGEVRRADPGAAPPVGRNMFSPDIRNDEFVQQEQRKVVEMLERECAVTGRNCALARSARKALSGK
ncbi:hypothetical protein [Sphingomonas colocasiae]|uniref:UrcA family protein n=1 Tax=Sphingomonas colocasiae TaxID=1848973 RepID=A0ABS7PKQ1_9SPHN|nr:hypothetical protein [Sphingomonas colocasiae]MBY8821872.1 hypothetical protein [Sphingomonas colocasiae]